MILWLAAISIEFVLHFRFALTGRISSAHTAAPGDALTFYIISFPSVADNEALFVPLLLHI